MIIRFKTEKRVQLRSIWIVVLLSVLATAAAGADLPASVEILRISDRRADVSLLKPYLEHEQANIRADACLAVGRIAGPATADQNVFPATALLAERLRRDSTPTVRAAAAFGLGLIQTEQAAVILASQLITDRNLTPELQAALIEALGRTGSLNHPLPFHRLLDHNDPVIVQTALLAVWRGSVLPHLDKIIALSHGESDDIRWCAAYALMRCLGAPPAGRTPAATRAPLSDNERRKVLTRLTELAADTDLRVRLQAMRSLRSGEGNQMLAVEMKQALLSGLRARDPRLRVEALRSLAGLDAGTGELDPLLPLLKDPHPHVRIEAIRALGSIAEVPVVLARLASILEGGNRWERAVAIETALTAFTEAGLYVQALHLIDRTAAESDWTVRFAAGNALASLWQSVRESAGTNESESTGRQTAAPVDLSYLNESINRYRGDDPRVAKAVIYPWIVQQDQGNVIEWLSALSALLHHDDEVYRLLAIDGIRERLIETGACTADGNCSLSASDLDQLLRITGLFVSDPSPDVRETLAPLLTLLAQSSAREQIEHQQAQLAGFTPEPRITDYQQVIRKALLAREAIWETESGTVRAELFGANAPLTVYNFIQLVDAGYYGNSAWHRVVPDFVVQDGCPRGDGWGGPGYAIRCEYNPYHYSPGMLGMALSGKDTGGSQYFFTLSDQPHLDGRYTIFGRLIDGWDVLTEINQGERIKSIRIVYGK